MCSCKGNNARSLTRKSAGVSNTRIIAPKPILNTEMQLKNAQKLDSVDQNMGLNREQRENERQRRIAALRKLR